MGNPTRRNHPNDPLVLVTSFLLNRLEVIDLLQSLDPYIVRASPEPFIAWSHHCGRTGNLDGESLCRWFLCSVCSCRHVTTLLRLDSEKMRSPNTQRIPRGDPLDTEEGEHSTLWAYSCQYSSLPHTETGENPVGRTWDRSGPAGAWCWGSLCGWRLHCRRTEAQRAVGERRAVTGASGKAPSSLRCSDVVELLTTLPHLSNVLLFLVASLLLVVRPGAPSSVLAPSSKARSP